VQERLALGLHSFEMQKDFAEVQMRDTSASSNLNEVIKDMITAGEVIETNKLHCAGKVKASLLIQTSNGGSKHIVEIVEDELAHFYDNDG